MPKSFSCIRKAVVQINWFCIVITTTYLFLLCKEQRMRKTSLHTNTHIFLKPELAALSLIQKVRKSNLWGNKKV